MRDENNERYPPYLPFYYKIYFVLRKLYRQTITRIYEKKAKKNGPIGIEDDGQAHWAEPKQGPVNNPSNDINTAAFWIDEDMAIPGVKSVADGINALKE